MKKRFLLVVAAFGMAVVAASFHFGSNASATATGVNSLLVPSTSSAVVAPNQGSRVTALSANGKFAIVDTSSTNSILGNTDGDYKILNLDSNAASDFIVSTAGVAGSPTERTANSAISETGRYVAFTSADTNLIDGTTTSSSYTQLYLRDMQSNTTTLLSQDSSGNLANANIIGVEGVSSDGRFVLFATAATNLAPSATNGSTNFIMLDRSADTFTIINLDTSGNDPSGQPGNTGGAVMSCDGSLVVFAYVGQIDGSGYDYDTVYLLDRRAGNKLINLTGDFSAVGSEPTISCNGNYIGFISSSSMIDPGFTQLTGQQHAYLYNRISGSYHLLDQSTTGVAGNDSVAVSYDAPSYDDACYGSPYGFSLDVSCLRVSDNGIAAFSSYASNLASSAPTGVNAYVRNINTGETDLVTNPITGSVEAPSPIGISADGKTVVYNSTDSDIVSGGTDTNNASDAFKYQTGF